MWTVLEQRSSRLGFGTGRVAGAEDETRLSHELSHTGSGTRLGGCFKSTHKAPFRMNPQLLDVSSKFSPVKKPQSLHRSIA